MSAAACRRDLTPGDTILVSEIEVESGPRVTRVFKLFVLLPFLCGLPALAQTSPLPSGTAPADVPPAPARPAESAIDAATAPVRQPAGSVFFELDANGRIMPVSPADALRAGAEFLQELENEQPPSIPNVYLSRVWIEGEARSEFADLTAIIGIEVTRDTGWFDVPLALNQAHVYSSEHTGPGAAAARVGGATDEGLHWTVSGRGTHQLTLKFRAPVRSSPAGQQLQLTLPMLPPQFRTRCRLRLPEGWEMAPVRPGAGWTPREVAAADSQVEFDVAGQRLEATWRRRTDAGARVSRTVTLLNVRRASGKLQLTALQEFEVEQGTLSQVEVRLPRDFSGGTVRRLGVAGPEARPLEFAALDGRPGWVFVDLNEPLSGRFELEWSFTRPFPSAGGRVVADGLEVAGAADQQGQIQVEATDGYDLHCLEQEHRGLQPINADGRTGLRRYEFFQQPFELALEITRATPRLDARTDYYLWLEPEQAALYCGIELSVLSGIVDTLLLEWPGGADEAWTCRAAALDVHLESGVNGTSEKLLGTLEFPPSAVERSPASARGVDADTPAASPDSVAPGQLRLRLSRPVIGRFPAPTRLRLVVPFSRPLAPGTDRFPLTLPRVPGADFTPGAIVVSGALELEPSLSVESEPLEPLPAPTDFPADAPSDFEDSRSARFQAPAAPQLIEASWVSHQRSVAADALLGLEEQRDDSLRVVQRIVYDVRHGRLGSLLLELPAALQDQFPIGAERLAGASTDLGLQVRLPEGERPLDVQRQGGNLRVVLPAARHGTFEIQIEYALQTPPAVRDQPVPFDLPVVTSLDARFTNTVLSVRDAGRIRLRESEPGWRKSRTLSGGIAWQAAGSPPSIPLVVDDSPLNIPQQYTVDSVFLRTRFGPAGEARTDAEFAVHAAPARIVLLVPDAARDLEFLWNGDALSPATDARGAEAGLIPYVLDLPADGELPVTGRLRLHYVTPAYDAQDLAARGLVEFPSFPGQVRVRETRWELLLPPGHLLARSPPDMAPQFAWQRRTAVWVRRPTPDYLNRRSELTSLEPQGDAYAFAAAGPVRRVEFAAMSQSLIVLIGAGVSLLLGFLFRRVPATRSLFSLLLLGFLLALAGLWYLELMQLLLQPALLGLFLAAVATALDVAARRRDPAARADSTFVPSTSSGREPRSSAASSHPPAPAPTALYRPAGASDSGGHR